MSPRLCSVCRNIKEDFWSRAYDLFEFGHAAKARLQSYNDMQQQSKNGCQLCTLIVTTPLLEKPKDADVCLFLRRNTGEPHRLFCLAENDSQISLAKMYFFRVPDEWCKSGLLI